MSYGEQECGCEECTTCLNREVRSLEKALRVMTEARAADAETAEARATAAEAERDDYKFQLESVIAEKPYWDELDRKLTNLAGGLEGTALAIAEARLRGAEGERDRLRELLEADDVGDDCPTVHADRSDQPCERNGGPCWWHRRRAALAVIPHTEGEAK